MTEEIQNSGMGIGADVILEFSKSISNIQAFGEQMELLDSRFGKLDQRIDAMKSSLSALSTQTSKATGSSLRKQIEDEVSSLLMANGIALTAVGSAPLKVKKDTVQHLFARVDAELNRAILKQVGNINIKIDPNYNSGTVPIGKDEFDDLNKEIARLVKVQVKNLTDSIKKHGGEMFKKEDLAGLQLDISKSTVKDILRSVRDQIKPAILNPKVDVEGAELKFGQKDMQGLLNKIRDKVKSSLDINLDGVINGKKNDVSGEFNKTALKIDNLLEDYVKGIRNGLSKVDPRSVEVPVQNLSKRLQKYIADDLKATPEKLSKDLGTVDIGSVHDYEFKRQFEGLEKTINNKVTSGTSKLLTEIKKSVKAVELEPSGDLKHHLIQEINKLNNDIVKKIRESVDKQFTYMRGEVGTVDTDPKAINRAGKMKSMSSSGGGGNVTYNTYNTTNNSASKKGSVSSGYSDPYARRDNYMNGFGLEGAVTNTLRHIVAGSMVGAPMMAIYSAFDTFRTSQQEQLKIMQNMSLKDEYKDKSTGQTNWGNVESDSNSLMGSVRKMSNFYALDYSQMSQVAAVASRLTSDKEEAQQFTDQSAKIYRLDNESDLVGTIAPGLEAIMAQFKLSVWDLDGVVNAFAVATNTTKATSDEVMKAMSRSGSALNASGVTAEQAIALNSIAIQRSGQSGEVVGNMFKTLASRVTLPTVVDSLKGKGIDVYKTNDMGLKERRSLVDILADTAKVTNGGRTGEDEISKIMLDEGGGYHYSKIMSFLDDMNKMGTTDLNFFKMMGDIKQFKENPELLQSMLSKTMNAPTVTMERAGVSLNNSLVSVLESMSPEIQTLSRNITNLATGIDNNARSIADVIGVLVNALIGFGAMYGIKRVGRMGKYEEHLDQAKTRQQFLGGKQLSGRQTYGAQQFLNSYLMGDSPQSKELVKKMTDKDFFKAAMGNDTLKPYFQELATMDRDRQRELRQYTKDTGKADSMADLFSIMDESRGYRRAPKEVMSADEMHQRALYNTSNIVNTKSLQDVFDKQFTDDIVNVLSDKVAYESLGNSSKGTVDRVATMDDGKRKGFQSYLENDYVSAGRTISSLEDLDKAIDSYDEKSRQLHQTNRQTSDSYRDLSRAVRDVGNEADKVTKSRMTGFLDFLDAIPAKAKGAGGALATIAKNVAGFAKQLAVAYVAGDVISGVTENSLLTDGQKKIRDHRVENNQSADEYVKALGAMDKKHPLSSAVGMATTGGKLLYNTLFNAVTPGHQKTDVMDVREFRKGFESWMNKSYGTSDASKAAQIATQQAREKDSTADKVTVEDLTKKYLDKSGANSKLQKLEEKDFIKQYKEFAISKAVQDTRQQKAEDARKAWENKMYESGDLQWFSTDQMKERINNSVEEVKTQSTVAQMNALLGGMKSDSEDYLKLRLEAIRKQRETYNQEIKALNDFVAEREKAVKYLEENNRKWKTDDDGKVVTKGGKKQTTSEYKEAKDALKEAKSKQAEVNKEFEKQRAELALEEQRTRVEGYISIAQNGASRAQSNKTYKDTVNSLHMNTSSNKYIDSQIGSSQTMISSMQSELDRLQGTYMADPDNKLGDAILGLQQQIASAQVEVKNLRLQKLQNWKTGFNDKMDDIEIGTLQKKVALGPGISDDSSVMRDIRIQQLQSEKTTIDKELAKRKADLSQYSKGTSEYEQIMADIRDLTKQSLNAQLGIHQELKQALGGTFNLPEGIKAISQYDYMANKGTHSNVTVQSGDMYVNITLPNVTGKTGSQQLQTIGQQIGIGLVSSRASSLRKQINSGVTAYRT